MLAALFLVAAAVCSITTEDPGYAAPPPPAPMEQPEKAALAVPDDFSSADGVLAFITDDRSVACSLTSARGEHIKLPYETNSFGDANNKLAIVPVAHCALATYPKPGTDDIKDDCAGTDLGYLGGVALLTPDNGQVL